MAKVTGRVRDQLRQAASDADELVLTPVGMVPKSNVHIVPQGGKILHSASEVRLLDADGKVLHASALKKSSKPFFTAHNKTEPAVGPRNLQSATVLALAQVSSVSGFQSRWVLPPLPQVNSGQLLMYFSGLAPPSIDALIQPTLQYGVSAAGGGNFWSVASWFITSTQIFVTNVTQLPTGNQILDSFVVNEDQFLGTPTTHAWFTGFSFFQASQLNIQTVENFNVAIVALEISNAITLGNLPTGPTDVEQIFILDANSNSIFPIPWQFSEDTADGITINRIPNTISGDETLFFQY
ncbi:hypothetical protein JR316_0009557 [Psilocybe cubensis]|uniref:Uncharacterized protein n=1 Tax=Psilocybe cubensis TaxID=181762 RepID=A0ACB8GNU6_PSICU|nr:hypothetical protein JR316_0009557 [Psilocybe cubensis]KAH9477351.1 hypothetical protein JR316_0009557 [Psilocybe cubensis]